MGLITCRNSSLKLLITYRKLRSRFPSRVFNTAGAFALPASMRKFQEQNEAHQASRAKMAEGMALALEKKDQVPGTPGPELGR